MTTKRISNQIIKCFKKGNKIFVMGNGGSNAMAQHMVEEFLCKFQFSRMPLPAYWCWAPTSIANDYGFEYVFSRHILALGRPGDIVVIFSTSGQSKNCLMAKKTAEQLGIEVIEIPRVGFSTAKIQEKQFKQMHDICRIVERAFI
jgi:D-sedoheptulose 7-phosphate isomerase